MGLRVRLLLGVCTIAVFTIAFSTCASFAETLQNPTLVVTGSTPRSLTAADLNGDGKLDFAYLDGSSTLHILLGNGDGTFQYASHISLPPGIGGAITVADVNNDSHPDILVGGGVGFQAEVATLLGDGTGAFSAPVISQFATTLIAFASLGVPFGVADFNGDGAADLIVCDPLNQLVFILLGDNTGSFTLNGTLGNSAAPNQVITGDFNHDGHPDFLVHGGLGENVTVYLGIGDGTFQPGVSYSGPHNMIGVVLADMDGDGQPDLVASDFANAINIFHGNPDGTFALTPAGGATVPLPFFTVVAVADFNGDGILDLAISSAKGIGILLGQGNLTYGPVTNFMAGATQLPVSPVIADFDSDTRLDFALPAPDGIVLLRGNADGTLQSVTTYDIGQGTSGVAIADFNGDGLPDIAANTNPPSPRILLGTASGKFVASPPSAAATDGTPEPFIFTADFNGDGKPDLLFSGSFPGTAVEYGNGDGTFSTPIPLPRSVTVSSQSAIADLGGNGIADVIAVDGLNAVALDIFQGETNNSFNVLSIPDNGLFFGNTAAVGDFNKDGRPDIAFQDSFGLRILLNNGNGTFTGGSLLPASGALAVADFDGDGNLDIVAATADQFVTGSGQFTVFFGNGDGTFQPGRVFPHTLKFLDQLSVADMDGDGRPDLIVTDDNLIVVVHYTGAHSFGPEVHYLAGSVGQFAVRDLNGDGRPDVVTGSGDVAVLLNQPGKTTPSGNFTVSDEPSALGQPLTLHLSLAPTTATGNVIFSVDGAPIANVSVTAGSASFTAVDTSNIGLGVHTFSASYTGNAAFTPGVFPLFHRVVPFIHPTSIVVTASPNPVVASQTVHLVVTVASAGPTPGGNVSFHDGSVNIGTVALNSTTGTGIFNTSLLGAGIHNITAIYQGDINSAPGTSSPVSVTVNGIATSCVLNVLPSAPQAGSSFALTASVTSASGQPLGSVVFRDGTDILGTRELDSSGTAVLTATFTSPGTHSFSASYQANGPFLGSASAPLGLLPPGTASMPSSTILSATQDAVSSLHLRANLHSVAPLGSATIHFFAGDSLLGDAIASQDGNADMEIAGVFPGTHYFTAVFSGRGQIAGSAATLLIGSPAASTPDFAFRASRANIVLDNSGSASLQVQVDAQNGFNDIVKFSCAAEANVKCSFSPAALSGGGISVLTLTPVNRVAAISPHKSPWLPASLAFFACGFVLLVITVSDRRRATCAFAGLLCLAAGCGTRIGRLPSAAANETSVTITARSASVRALSHSITVKASTHTR